MSELLAVETRRTPGHTATNSESVPSDVLAAVPQATAAMLGYARLASVDYASLAIGQVVGGTTDAAAVAIPVDDVRFISTSANDPDSESGLIEFRHVETTMFASDGDSTSSSVSERLLKSKRPLPTATRTESAR